VDVLVLPQHDVIELLDTDALIDRLADGFAALSSGQMNVPPRNMVPTEHGAVLAMPAWGPGLPVGVKLVSVYHGNGALGLPSHIAMMYLANADTGVPIAIMDGTHITTMRTAAAAALSARLAARADARVLAIIGGGVQAHAHVGFMPKIRPISDIRVYSPNAAHAALIAARHPAARVADTALEAVRGADIVSLCTSATTPVIEASWISPGTHVTSVGFAPPGHEMPIELTMTSRLMVESRMAFAPAPAGCVELAGLDPQAAAEIGEVVLGLRPGRVDDREITVYRSMGHAAEDLVAAQMVYDAAIAAGRGQMVEL
jgi:alanine dehydrogenase